MFNSWFHLKFFTQYLQSTLTDTSLCKPFTYEKGRLHIPIFKSQEFESLHLSVQPPLPFLKIEYNLPNPKNRVPIFKNLDGFIISKILLHKSDRQILVSFNNSNNYLLFQIFGFNGNVFLVNADFKIIETALEGKW